MGVRSIKKFKVAFGLACITLLTPRSCAREPHYSPVPLNQPMLLMPVSVNERGQVNRVIKESGGVHMTIYLGGAPIGYENGSAQINFYRNSQPQAFYETTWAQLKLDYKTSGCKADQIASLDGPLEAVLICDGRLGKLAEITRIEVISAKNGKVKSASDFSTYQRGDDVTAITFQLY